MTPEQQAAYVIAQSACAVVEAISLIADQLQGGDGEDGTLIRELINKYGIHHNAVVGLFER